MYFIEGFPVELCHDHGQVACVVRLDVETAALLGPLLFGQRRLTAGKVRGQSRTEPPSDPSPSPRSLAYTASGERQRGNGLFSESQAQQPAGWSRPEGYVEVESIDGRENALTTAIGMKRNGNGEQNGFEQERKRLHN